jgi:hypothetical protein
VMELLLSNNQQRVKPWRRGTNVGSTNTNGALMGRLGIVSNQRTLSTLLVELL